jgi:hypothetical protein
MSTHLMTRVGTAAHPPFTPDATRYWIAAIVVSDFQQGGSMRIIKRFFGLTTSKAQNTSLLEPTSLAAFGHMGADQQSMLAEALVANMNEQRDLRKAS